MSTSSFLNNTAPVARTGFQISLAFTSCTTSTVICNNIAVGSGGSNVGVQILKSDAATAISNAAEDIYPLIDGTNVFQYYAAYVNPGGAAVTAGSVSATAQLTVTYQ